MRQEQHHFSIPISGKIMAGLIICLWGIFMAVIIKNKPEPPILYMNPVKVETVESEILLFPKSMIIIETESAMDVINEFATIGYDLSNPRYIPKIYIPRLPKDIKKLSIPTKKDLFIKIVLPLILKENENIIYERGLAMRSFVRNTDKTRLIMKYLYKKYKLNKVDDEELLSRIMTVPVSLALAQTAIESGWGTSYYARQGNALFGQHAYKGQKALKYRDGKTGSAKFGVVAFDSLSISVRQYMNNLNTHRAYKGFRKKRVAASLSLGITLSNQLISYSERGNAYIRDIKRMIKRNNFTRYENSVLQDVDINLKKTLDNSPAP